MHKLEYALYKINNDIMACIDPETGEIDSEKFDALEIEREQKLEQLGRMYLNCIGDAKKIKAEIERLSERQNKEEEQAAKIKSLLELELHGEPFKTPLITVGYRKSEKLIVDDIMALPAEYLKYSAPTAKKADIKAALKRGENIGGVHIEEQLNMSIK